MKGIQNTVTGSFNSIISNNRRFVVPKFQRDYSWQSEQWDDLWQDIETMIEENDDHYMGYLVLQTDDEKNYYVIDGQQRFTTIILLILAAIKCIKKLVDQEIEVEKNQQRIDTLTNTYVGKIDPVTLEYDNILELNRNNDPYFRDYIVKLGELRVRNLKNTERLMRQCFNFYEQKLTGAYRSGQDYAAFIQKVVDGLNFTLIQVNDELNAFRVFETLNARGVQLSSADLLKNYLFSLVDRNRQHPSHIDALERKWAQLTDNIKEEKLPEFLRYYWNVSHKRIKASEVFKTIRRSIVDDKQVFILVDEMIRFSDVYMALANWNDEMWTDDDIKEDIKLLNLFRLKQPYSMLMAAKVYLPIAQFKQLLKKVIAICFRYNVICDRNPNDQDIPFNNLALLISSEGRIDFSLLQSIIIDDAEFKSAFSEKSFPYTSHNAKVIRYILGKIEHFKGATILVSFDDDNASVEHIFPQDAAEEWGISEEDASRMVFRLGNTCLLERKFNRDIQDASFSLKKEVYAKSSYYYAKYISNNYEYWNEQTIVRLQKEMSSVAVSIWKV